MNTLEQLVYCSRSRLAREDEAAAMADIVHVAAYLNARNGISGALTLQDGMFVQVLEGSPSALDILMLHLHFDERHEDIEVLCRDTIERRDFPAWGMAAPSRLQSEALGRLIAARSPDLCAWRAAMTELLVEAA
ncbi:BLUF domain-containing protein [Brevundimonas guildfordensis]|uniref:BLUF domain-containing protein n=1 Tax=Brevundimonas guildfordensis TaxID=2762241 RepID=A0ABR8R2T6_9CAUL|nr:BLUF domain-containing protein [Brevundimonas guildfordensis]MBD7942085.1 BLUF domain-containing protein [Brevundimonas guildfordensis]